MKLIKNITVSLSDNYASQVELIKSVTFGVAEVECNYIKLGSFEGFLFNYKNMLYVNKIANINSYGLLINSNKNFIELDISY